LLIQGKKKSKISNTKIKVILIGPQKTKQIKADFLTKNKRLQKEEPEMHLKTSTETF
jgi:hypothetical protein